MASIRGNVRLSPSDGQEMAARTECLYCWTHEAPVRIDEALFRTAPSRVIPRLRARARGVLEAGRLQQWTIPSRSSSCSALGRGCSEPAIPRSPTDADEDPLRTNR